MYRFKLFIIFYLDTPMIYTYFEFMEVKKFK